MPCFRRRRRRRHRRCNGVNGDDRCDDACEQALLAPMVYDGTHEVAVQRVGSKRREITRLMAIAWPVAVSSFCRMIMAVSDVAVLGRMDNGTQYLAASSLAFVVMDVAVALPAAAADALNQLCAQAHGANNKILVGRWLQIGVVITSVLCVPVMIAFCFTGRILEFVGTSRELASLANTFACWSILGILPNTFYYTIRQYFQAQNIVMPALLNNVGFVFVNLALNIVFVHGLHVGAIDVAGLGFIGSPIATSVSRTLQPISFVLYACVCKRLHRPTWPSGSILPSFTRARIKEFFAQALPSMIGNAAEQWQMEIVTLMAAHLGIVDVATQSAVFNVFFALHCFAFGVGKATTVRVGYHLGFGSPDGAKQASLLSFGITTVLGVVVGVVLLLGRNLIGHIYSSDAAVWKDTSSIAAVLGCGYVGVSWLISFSATLLGQGRSSAVAAIAIGCSWLVSLPLSYALAFWCHLNLLGLWFGLTIGYFLYTISAGVLVVASDWRGAALDAMRRSEQPLLASLP